MQATEAVIAATESRNAEPKTVPGSVRRRLSAVFALLVLSIGLTLAVAPSAGATQYTSGGKYDLRGFVTTGTPYFGCYTGSVSYGGITVRAPSNLGVLHVYTTEYIQRFGASGQWTRYDVGQNNASPNPGGIVLNPNQSKTVPTYRIATPAGYYWSQTRLDFVAASGLVGTVYINPSAASDWNSQYRYQASGYSYCWHG